MSYIPLKKLYYSISFEEYDLKYSERVHSPYVQNFDVRIKAYHRINSYPAFVGYSPEILLLIQSIYQKYIALLSLLRFCPDIMIHQYCMRCMIDEIQSTNEIEGVRSTKRQIQNVLHEQSVPKNFRHLVSLVDKYKKIMDDQEIKFSTCQDIRKFYEDFALDEVLQENPEYALDGMIFRKGAVDITSKTDRSKHQGVFPESAIIHDMTEALSILHDQNIPVLIRLSVFHYLFEYIHPFYDGNGRTGRFIISYYLAKEFHHIIAFQLSVIINKNKKTYYDLFEEADNEWNRGELTSFVYGFLQFIDQAFSETLSRLQKKRDQLQRFANKLFELIQSKDPLEKDIYFILLQASLFSGVGVTMKDLIETTQRNKITIRNRLQRIPNEYLLSDLSRKPYRYRLNMKIFLPADGGDL